MGKILPYQVNWCLDKGAETIVATFNSSVAGSPKAYLTLVAVSDHDSVRGDAAMGLGLKVPYPTLLVPNKVRAGWV